MPTYESILKTRAVNDFDYHTLPMKRLSMMYVVTPKVACTTIKCILYTSEYRFRGDAAAETALMADRATAHKRFNKPVRRFGKFGEDEQDWFLNGDDVFRFTFVRNPYERVLSAYLNKIRFGRYRLYERFTKLVQWENDTPPTFREFLELVKGTEPGQRDPHWMNQALLTNIALLDYGLVGRMEQFNDDIQKVFAHIPEAERMEIGRPNNATNATSRVNEYYDDETRRLAGDIYADDCEYFGYSFPT